MELQPEHVWLRFRLKRLRIILLRLLDADRARIEADLAWVRGMTEYHQSIVRLEAAEGVSQK